MKIIQLNIMSLVIELLLQCVLQLRNWVLCLIAISHLTIMFPMFVEQPFLRQIQYI